MFQYFAPNIEKRSHHTSRDETFSTIQKYIFSAFTQNFSTLFHKKLGLLNLYRLNNPNIYSQQVVQHEPLLGA